MSTINSPLYVPGDTGPSYWGPHNRYIFLVTGAQSEGAYFIMEAVVPPGGGPPPHFHQREQESIFVLQGTVDIQIGSKVVPTSGGDFVHIPRGLVHCFRNTGPTTARVLLIFAPGGLEGFFEGTLEKVYDRSAEQPPNMGEVVARYLEAGPRYGVEFL